MVKSKVATWQQGGHSSNTSASTAIVTDAYDTSDIKPPGWTKVFASGEWVERYEGGWRDSIDLATADRPTVYAAGRDDGYRMAWSEMAELHKVLVDWLEIMQIECLERCACGRKLRHIKAKADGFYPDCDKGWSV